MPAEKHTNLISSTAPPTRCDQCAVRQRALFQGVPLEQLEWTQRYRRKQFTVQKRQSLFLEHDQHEFTYTLYSGWIMLSKTTASGRRQILRFALPGDFLGFQPNLNGPMTYSAHAITEVRLCAFERKGLEPMMTQSPELARRMALLNAKDTELTQQLLMATQQPAAERVTSLLMQLFIRVQSLGNLVAGSDADSIELPISQSMLAEALGMTPETVNRTLKVLRDQGVLEVKAKRLAILDEARALEISEVDPVFIQEQALL